MTNLEIWSEHLGFGDIKQPDYKGCRKCRIAIRGRFAGLTTSQMKERCCDDGKVLYENFLRENVRNYEL